MNDSEEDIRIAAGKTSLRRRLAQVTLALAAGLLALVLAAGCRDAATECLAGEPRPIFRDGDPTVAMHEFAREGQSSVETVAFEDGLLLAVAQGGCDTLVQDFTLSRVGYPRDYAAFVPEAAAAFYALAGLAPRLASFSEYGRILSSVPVDGPEGAPVDLAPGLTVRISGLPTPERVTWRVRFTQDLGGRRTSR